MLRPIANPPNPYLSEHREWLEPPPAAQIEVYEERAKSILSENDSPDIPFRWSVNPYRGCQHACAYCYARPYHEYLNLGAGTDFDTKLVAKVNAPELLRQAFSKRGWSRESVSFSGITDCYQPIEASYRLTRGCLEVCREFRNPVSVITKGCLVLRDLELLAEMHRSGGAHVYQSIPFEDDATARLIEPQAPPPSRRFEVMRRLCDAGIEVGIMIAPIIPGLNDSQVPAILERAAAAGAKFAGYVPLRLPKNVAPVFLERLREAMPGRAARIESRIREMRGGALNKAEFGSRMRGEGAYWTNIQDLFRVAAEKHGVQTVRPESEEARGDRTAVKGQEAPGLSLFPDWPSRSTAKPSLKQFELEFPE